MYLGERSVTFTPASNPCLGKKKRIVFHPVLFFPHVPSSDCESQYDLSARVRGKWAGHCQLLYPEGGWGSTRMSVDLCSYMKVAVDVAHYCFERLHLKNTIWVINLRCFLCFLFFFLHYISDLNKTRKECSTYGKQIITWGTGVMQRANNPRTKNTTISSWNCKWVCVVLYYVSYFILYK